MTLLLGPTYDEQAAKSSAIAELGERLTQLATHSASGLLEDGAATVTDVLVLPKVLLVTNAAQSKWGR
jgi:hypothetical protein